MAKKKTLRAELGKTIKVELKKESVELKDPKTKGGMMFNSPDPMGQHLLFVPDDEAEFEELKYQCSGKLYSYKNGTVEFIRSVRKRSTCEQLMRTEHGVLTRTSNDYYLLQIRIPIDGKKKPDAIIRNECNEIADCIV